MLRLSVAIASAMVPAMTLPGTITAATPAAPPQRAVWRAEVIETVKLAWPITLTQLGQIAMMTTDLALIGRLGDGAIAAVGLAHLILFVGFVFGMGPVSAVAPLAAGLRRTRPSHGPPLAAGGTLGRGDARRSRQCCTALGRGHSRHGRAVICDGGARRPLSDRIGMVDDPGLVLHRVAQLHGRGQSSGTGAAGHHRCHPREWTARLCPD